MAVDTNPLDGQPMVKLYHPALQKYTTQPRSCAQNLLQSGWRPATVQAAEQLGLDPTEVPAQRGEPAPVMKRPDPSDGRLFWIRYARQQGYEGDDDVTKAELIQEYGKDE